MIAMPVLALHQMHQAKPSDVAAGILTRDDSGFGVTNAVDEALRMEREAQANRAEPEKCCETEIQRPEI
jgi:hypothetical protein